MKDFNAPMLLEYLAWNAMIMGTVTLATIYDVKAVLWVASFFFGLEACLCLLAIFLSGSKEYWEEVTKKPGTIALWKAILEPAWCLMMLVGLGHVFNGVCMAFAALVNLYLVALKYQKQHEANEQEEKR